MSEKRDFENQNCQFHEFWYKIIPYWYDSSVSTASYVPKIRANGGLPVFGIYEYVLFQKTVVYSFTLSHGILLDV